MIIKNKVIRGIDNLLKSRAIKSIVNMLKNKVIGSIDLGDSTKIDIKDSVKMEEFYNIKNFFYQRNLRKLLNSLENKEELRPIFLDVLIMFLRSNGIRTSRLIQNYILNNIDIKTYRNINIVLEIFKNYIEIEFDDYWKNNSSIDMLKKNGKILNSSKMIENIYNNIILIIDFFNYKDFLNYTYFGNEEEFQTIENGNKIIIQYLMDFQIFLNEFRAKWQSRPFKINWQTCFENINNTLIIESNMKIEVDFSQINRSYMENNGDLENLRDNFLELYRNCFRFLTYENINISQETIKSLDDLL